MVKICIVNDWVKPLSGEKENLWTWLLESLPAEPIHFAELKIPLEDAIEQARPDIIINNDLWGLTFPNYFTITIAQNPYKDMQKLLGGNFSEQIEKQKRVLKNSQIRVAVSNYMAYSYKELGNFEIIPVGTNSELFHPMNKEEMRKKYGIPSNRMVFISVLSHHPVKGWGEIKKEIEQRNVFWILIFKDYPDSYAENTKVFCRINQEQVAELMNCADFFVSKSVCESGGLASVEAMFCDTPVITPPVGLFWDFHPPMKHPRQEVLKYGLDKATCIKRWQELIRNIKL